MNTYTSIPRNPLSLAPSTLSLFSRLATLTLGFFLIASSALAQSEATFEGLGFLPEYNNSCFARGVSGDGSVAVGYCTNEGGDSEAVRWHDGVVQGLGHLPGGDQISRSSAYDASYDGSVIVGNSESENYFNQAFRWEATADTMIGLGDLGGFPFSAAYAVSADGSVVFGYSNPEDGGYQGFRWENGEMEGLGYLPGDGLTSQADGASADGSVVVGQGRWGEAGSNYEAIRWVDGEIEGLGDLPGDDALNSHAKDVSADGSVVVGQGNYTTVVSGEAFIWTEEDGMVGLGDLPGGEFQSNARAVSADGSVVVGSGATGNGAEAFIWTAADGMRSLKEVLENEYDLDLTGWTLTQAYGVSDDGTVIVGIGTNRDGQIEGWRAEAPFTVAEEATPEALADVLSTPSPNPASGTSTFTIAVERGQNVSVEVFNALGRHVQTVYDGVLAAGMSETLTLDASALPAGVYVIRATGEDFTKTRRVTVIR